MEVNWARGGVCMHDLGAGWPGNFSTHHVWTHVVKTSAKRETSPQNMNQVPHELCIQPIQNKQESVIPKIHRTPVNYAQT